MGKEEKGSVRDETNALNIFCFRASGTKIIDPCVCVFVPFLKQKYVVVELPIRTLIMSLCAASARAFSVTGSSSAIADRN